MFAGSHTSTPRGKVADLFAPDIEQKKIRKRKSSEDKNRRLLYRKLYEVIYGQRPALKVFSSILQTDIWFVNEGLVNPNDKQFDGKIITMEMLAEFFSKNKNIVGVIKKLIT